jgi:hypothetical protein
MRGLIAYDENSSDTTLQSKRSLTVFLLYRDTQKV